MLNCELRNKCIFDKNSMKDQRNINEKLLININYLHGRH